MSRHTARSSISSHRNCRRFLAATHHAAISNNYSHDLQVLHFTLERGFDIEVFREILPNEQKFFTCQRFGDLGSRLTPGFASLESSCARNNRSRMNYDHVSKDGYPINSDEVEAVNKVLVTQRTKRSGQSRGRDGGQGELVYRAQLKFDHFDRAQRIVVPKMKRS